MTLSTDITKTLKTVPKNLQTPYTNPTTHKSTDCQIFWKRSTLPSQYVSPIRKKKKPNEGGTGSQITETWVSVLFRTKRSAWGQEDRFCPETQIEQRPNCGSFHPPSAKRTQVLETKFPLPLGSSSSVFSNRWGANVFVSTSSCCSAGCGEHGSPWPPPVYVNNGSVTNNYY